MSQPPNTKEVANLAYHAAVVTGLAVGYAQLGKKLFKGGTPKLDYTVNDVGMVTADIALAFITQGVLVKQGIIPPNILN